MSNEEHFERFDLRQQVTATLRARRDALAGTLSSVLAAEVPLGVDAGAWATLAGQLLDAISAFTESGQTDSNTEVLDALERHTHLLLGTKQLFACVHLAERTCLEDLGRQGTARFESSAVDQLVKRASSDLVSSLTQRLAVTPAHAAIRDPLTTLLVRTVFDLALAQEVTRARRHQHPLSLILLDVDQLAAINATYGFGVGDLVLERTGIFVRSFFRTYDWVARHEEDSIVVLLPETPLDDAQSLAERVRAMVEQRLVFVDHNTNARVRVTLSAAAVGNDLLESELDPDEILAEAARAVQRAKRSGRNRVERAVLLPMSVGLHGAASLLACDPAVVRRLIREGHLSATDKGGNMHIDRTSLESYRRNPSFEPQTATHSPTTGFSLTKDLPSEQ